MIKSAKMHAIYKLIRIFPLLFLFIFLEVNVSLGQFTITASNNATNLANEMVGSGASVSSATLTCANGGAGIFSGGSSTSLGLNSGIVLTTGTATQVKGSASSLMQVDNSMNGVTQLDNLLTQIGQTETTEDGCILDVTLVPVCNVIQIKYVFGSEEYDDYVGQGYSDVFGFFVNGPNPAGGNYSNKNIALVPGTNTPVTINSINNGPEPFFGGPPTGPCKNCQYYVYNGNSSTIKFDGLTTKLTATVNVVPCQSYTIRLAIADAGDGLYDSGVFLEADGVTCPVSLTATPSPATICIGQSSSITATATNIATGTYSWSTGETGATISVSPAATTTYTCFYTSCNGLTVQQPVTVNVNPVAGASFNFTPDVFCKGTANPLPTITNGSGTFSGTAGLTINSTTGEIDLGATAPGTYTVSFAASGMCPNTLTQDVVVQNIPNVVLTGGGTVCTGDSSGITLTFTGTAPYTYTYGSPAGNITGQTDSSVLNLPVTQSGAYSIVSMNDGGCAGTVSGSANLVVNALPTATISGGGNYCAGSTPPPVVISLTGAAPYSLTFDVNGTSQTVNAAGATYTYTPVATDTVSLVYVSDNNTCSDSVLGTAIATQKPLPTGTVTGGGSVCFGMSAPDVVFTLTGTAPWTLNYSDGTANLSANVSTSPYSITSPPGGTYTIVSITDSNTCNGTGTGSVPVVYFPAVTATAAVSQEICVGQTATLTATGGISASWSPTPTISGANSYTATSSPLSTTIYTVTVQDSAGCKDTAQITLTVYPKPIVNFTAPRVCEGTPTVFNDSSFIAGPSTISSYSWDIGDATIAFAAGFSHVYSACNTYTVSLAVESNKGCRDSIIKQVQVACMPVTSFTMSADSVCPTVPVSFTNTSVANVGSTTLWNFGLGTSEGSSTQVSPSHNYLNHGSYNVELIVTTLEGCIDKDTMPVYVYYKPVADFTSSVVCLNDSTQFLDNSTVSNSTITAWLWDFDTSLAGIDDNVQNPSYVYPLAQLYSAQLIVTDAFGCSDTVIKQIDVKPLPVPDFAFANVCDGNLANFTNTSNIADNSVLTYSWDFTLDGIYDQFSVDAANLYPTDSSYQVKLVAVSPSGCVDSITKSVVVYPSPVANFVADVLEGCEPLRIKLTPDSVMQIPSVITNYYWYYNGTIGDSTMYPEKYFTAGTYDVKLIVNSNFGCKDSIEIPAYILSNPLPVADFTYDPNVPTVLNPTVNFYDQSQGIISAWQWSLGDTTNLSSLKNNETYLEYTYPDSGTYCVDLKTTTNKGCIDTVRHCIYVKPEYAIYIPNTFTPGNDLLNNTFEPKGIGINITKDFEMYIYDRWGNEIYKTTDITKGWDGKNDAGGGKICQADVYIYKIRLRDVFNRKHEYSGQVNLIR